MTNLTEKQTKQAQDLIEKYGFCTLETQKELAKAGFFEKVKCNLSLCVDSNNETIEIWGNAKESIVLSRFTLIPMPQMGEVWKRLPMELFIGKELYIKVMDGLKILYGRATDGNPEYSYMFEINITEAMCQLWLKLHKEGLL